MKNVIIKSLTLRNFKGIQNISIDFGFKTDIFGKNRAGKTTISDAYFWLLYGKDSQDRTDFEIKTLDSFNFAIPKLEHEVVGVFEVDGVQIKLSKVYKEKWTKKRGNDTEEMTGHDITYFVNDVPTSATDYKKQVSNIIDESISKILTNHAYFNEKLKWQDRREMLSSMAGNISDQMVVNGFGVEVDFSEVVSIIEAGKNLDDEKKIIAVQKKRLKEELQQIPSRLDELSRQKPEPLNWEELSKEIGSIFNEINSKTSKIDSINESIASQKEAILQQQKEKFEKEKALNELSQAETNKVNERFNAVKSKRQEIQNQINDRSNEINSLLNQDSKINVRIFELSSLNSSLRADFAKYSEQIFSMDPSSSCCPTCKRQLENAEEIESDLRSNFNKNKLEKIESINKQGKANAEEIKQLEAEKTQIAQRIAEIDLEVKALNENLLSPELTLENPTIEIQPTEEMKKLKAEIDAIVIDDLFIEDVAEIRKEIEELNFKKRGLELEYNKKENIKSIDRRIFELNDLQRVLSQDLATLEKVEIQIERFNKCKIEMVENAINSKFSFVKFKMFETQLNGGETPACECLVNGVPYSSLNTESKINASLDIINAFQNHYETFAPIFIDGRESVTELIPTKCQLISLIVDPSKDKLTVQ